MRRALIGAIASLMAGWTLTVTGQAQDFQKTYPIVPDAKVRIRSISGEVRIQSYDGQNVTVAGFKTGRNRDRVEILDHSAENRIDLPMQGITT